MVAGCCGAKNRAVNTCCLCSVLLLQCSHDSAPAPVLALQFMLRSHAPVPVLMLSAPAPVLTIKLMLNVLVLTLSRAQTRVLMLQCSKELVLMLPCSHAKAHARCSHTSAHTPVFTLQCRRKTRAKRKSESISHVGGW